MGLRAGCRLYFLASQCAAGISPFHPEASSIQAAKMMLEMMKKYVEKGESFSFETTLSGKNDGKLIPGWQKKGIYDKVVLSETP
jgi:predicted ABC-type ATPase